MIKNNALISKSTNICPKYSVYSVCGTNYTFAGIF